MSALYTVSLDGGVIGDHIMRGEIAHYFEAYFEILVINLGGWIVGTGCALSIGWVSDPTALISSLDPSSFSGTPSIVSSNYEKLHYGPAEPFAIRVSVADATAGSLAMVLSRKRV